METAVPPLRSRLLGRTDLAAPPRRTALAAALERVRRFPVAAAYSEYTFGSWHAHVLANGSGDERDGDFRGHAGPYRLTALGRAVPELIALVEETFDTARLMWIRVFAMQDGLLISHRDFLEFERPYARLQIPLQTDPTCLHSEEEHVFHLRQGEIWQLAASAVHAATSVSPRLALCLDFDPRGAAAETLLRRPDPAPPAPHLVERPALEPARLEALLGLGGALEAANLREAAGLLGRVHFYRRAHAAAGLDWLVEAARRAADPALHAKAAAFRRYCVERRAYGERFAW